MLQNIAFKNLFVAPVIANTTDMEFYTAEEAYTQAEFFTSMGFEANVVVRGNKFICHIE